MNPFAVTAAFLGLMSASTSQAASAWSLKAASQPVTVTGKLLDPINVSGAASVKDGEVVFACDELLHGVQAGHLDLAKGQINVTGPEISLLEGNKKELDLEAIAADPEHHCYYTCGSCSLSRKKGKESPDRQWLFRVETDPKTGALLPGKVTKVSLRDAMKTDAFLNEHMDKSAEDLGIDIEGLAFKEGRLWFGLRSPSVNGWGFVVAASAADLMANKGVLFQRYELPLGEDLGVRDIVPVNGGFLLIAGPSGALESKVAIKEAAPPPPVEVETVAKVVIAKPEVETVAKPEVETVAKAEVETVAKPEVETVAKAQVETVAKPAAVTVAKAAPAPKAAPAGKAAPTGKPSPAAKAAPPPKAAPAPAPVAKVEVAKPVPLPLPVVAPPAISEERFGLFFWQGDNSRPLRIGDLPRPKSDQGGHGKPEGLLVVSETVEKIGVLVFSDGVENGAPTLYEVTRKTDDMPKRVK